MANYVRWLTSWAILRWNLRTCPGPKALEKAREIFDLRGSLAALALTTDPAAFKRFRAEINNVAGLAKKTHDKMEEGLGGAFRFIVSRVQELAIVIGDAIDKEFRDFFNILVKLLDATGEWARNNQDVIVQFVKYVAAITVAGTAMIAFGLAIKVAALALTPVLIALKAISFGIGAFVFAFKALVVIITGGAAFINAAMISMSAVLALVKASFIALTGTATVGWTAAFVCPCRGWYYSYRRFNCRCSFMPKPLFYFQHQLIAVFWYYPRSW